MSYSSLARVSAIALLLAAGCGRANEPAPDVREPVDVAAVSSAQYRVMLDNEYMRVLRVTLEPGARDTMHTHPPNAWYSLTAGAVRLHEADGSASDTRITAGQAGFEPAGTLHAWENIGTADLDLVLVERKGRPTRETSGAEAVDVSPEVYTLLAENEDFRVLDARLAPGARDNPHGHRTSIFYILDDGRMRIHPADGGPVDLQLRTGEVNFQEVEIEHRLENRGDTDLRLITFELKR